MHSSIPGRRFRGMTEGTVPIPVVSGAPETASGDGCRVRERWEQERATAIPVASCKVVVG